MQWITDRESPHHHHSRPLDFDPNPQMRYNCQGIETSRYTTIIKTI